MSNHHLRNENLSLKAKGLLSQMLSLPDNWDYSLLGLAKINRDQVTSVKSAVDELIAAGYVTRISVRDSKGKYGGYDYNVYEFPQQSSSEDEEESIENTDNSETMDNCPYVENPYTENPHTDNPHTENPYSEKPPQLNTNILNTNINKYVNKNDDHHMRDRPHLDDEIVDKYDLELMNHYIDALGRLGLYSSEQVTILKENAVGIAKALDEIYKEGSTLSKAAKEKRMLEIIIRRMKPEPLSSPMNYVREVLRNEIKQGGWS